MVEFSRSQSQSVVAVFILIVAEFALPKCADARNFLDKPLDIKQIFLKPGPADTWSQAKITCFHYRKFVVKQIDFGEIGAELSIIPVQANKVIPCELATQQNEYVIPDEIWNGYFRGLKSDFAILDDSDGNNGGMRFMVFRLSDNRNIFEDTAEGDFHSVNTKDGKLSIRYRRVFVADCSMVTGGAACRNSIEKRIRLSLVSLSSCGAQYQAAKLNMAKARCEAKSDNTDSCFKTELANLDTRKWDSSPTVIVYGVDVSLGDGPPVIEPRGNVLGCHPAD